MTLTAFSLCRDVVINLRRGNARVMAGCAIATHYIRVMDKSASEGSKVVVISVAGRAIQVGRYMTKRLACADISVMARCAIVYDANVVKRRTSKGRGVMASIAIQEGIGRYVI